MSYSNGSSFPCHVPPPKSLVLALFFMTSLNLAIKSHPTTCLHLILMWKLMKVRHVRFHLTLKLLQTCLFLTAISISVGWGNTKTTAREYPKVLQQAALPLVPTDTCQRTYSVIEFYGETASFAVPDSMLVCAGFAQGNGVGSSGGDSGSPAFKIHILLKSTG